MGRGRCGVAWRGVVWCGVACGVVRCGVVWCDVWRYRSKAVDRLVTSKCKGVWQCAFAMGSRALDACNGMYAMGCMQWDAFAIESRALDAPRGSSFARTPLFLPPAEIAFEVVICFSSSACGAVVVATVERQKWRSEEPNMGRQNSKLPRLGSGGGKQDWCFLPTPHKSLCPTYRRQYGKHARRQRGK